jgi:prolipoprotein diacylglyceryltransferase
MLYTAPSGAVQVLFLWIGVLGNWIFPNNRTHVVLALIIPPLVGNVLLLKLSLDAGWGMIAASWLASCITSVMSLLLSLTASNVKGNTKRSVVSAVFFIGYCAGCIAAPQLWTEKPRYFKGVVTALVTWCMLFVVVIAYWLVCKRDNAKRDYISQENDVHEMEQDVIFDKNGAPVTDLTDKEDPRFRYSW